MGCKYDRLPGGTDQLYQKPVNHIHGIVVVLRGELVYGGGRRRRGLPAQAAAVVCDAFLSELLPRIEAHGTQLCFEPLGPRDTDFLNTAKDCLMLVQRFNHPALCFQLDAKALVENGEDDDVIFQAAKGCIGHYHANDPGLVVVGSTGIVNHRMLGRHLAAVGYDGWVSIEQRQLSETAPVADLAASIAAVRQHYGAAC